MDGSNGATRDGPDGAAEIAALRAEIERLRAERDAAERAAAARAKVFAAASHDLRQPFQSMRLFLHVLERRVKDEEGRQVAGHLRDAMEGGEALLNALLDLSAIDAGGMEPEIRTFEIQPLYDRLVAEYRAQAGERKLVLRAHPCRFRVRSDPVLLERILRNLLSNALAYTETGRVVIGCRRRGDKLRIEVWDTGVGIPEDRQREIFEEFRRLEAGGRRGLGLGLAIVQRLCRLLGHRIELRSRPGRGSVFAVEVPLAESGIGARAPRPAAEARPLGGRTAAA